MLYLGTSGWSYKDWGERFYPPGLAPREQLHYLAQHFSTVELNASFYRLPAATSFEKWYNDTPAEFRFAIKVPRVITHLKRLADVRDDWQLLHEHSRPLGEKLAVYLVQLPPSFRADAESLARFGEFLDYAQEPAVRLAVELRHASWFDPEGLRFFAEHGVCVVQADSSRFPHTPPELAPADFTYYRLHGPRRLYASQYTGRELSDWATRIKRDQQAGRDVYVYFDNDNQGYALEDARLLGEILSR